MQKIHNMKQETTKKKRTNPQQKERTAGTLKLKDWALEDRPREKLITNGKKNLSNAELLAILISSGTVGQSAVELAKEILNSVDNDLSMLSRQGIRDLTDNFKGMGEAKAVTIIAAMELGYRMLTEQSAQKTHTGNDSMELFKYICPSIVDLPYEEFWAIYMNNKGKIIHKQRIASGGINETLVDIRRLYTTALEKNAIRIAVAHNHPSGDCKPSNKDNNLTKIIAEAGNILYIKLIDHLIIGTNNGIPTYFSYHDNGLL